MLAKLTRLLMSQAIANAIQQYSISLEQLFMAEVFPQTGAAEEEESWFKKAALAVKGGNKVDRFVFQVKVRLLSILLLVRPANGSRK